MTAGSGGDDEFLGGLSIFLGRWSPDPLNSSMLAQEPVGAGTKPDRDGSKPDRETEQNRISVLW